MGGTAKSTAYSEISNLSISGASNAEYRTRGTYGGGHSDMAGEYVNPVRSLTNASTRLSNGGREATPNKRRASLPGILFACSASRRLKMLSTRRRLQLHFLRGGFA